MASHPPAQCCTIGVRHDGEPTGTNIKIGQWDAYIAEPKGDKKHDGAALLYLPDVFSIWQNAKLIADQFAANGYYTVILDILNGDPMPNPRPQDLVKWLSEGSDGKTPHTKETVDPIVLSGLEYLKNQGYTKIGALGYCLGAKYVARHYKNGIKVGFVAHPSFVEEDELASVSGPLSIAAAETDKIFTAEKRHRSELILQEIGHPYQITLYSGVQHGFAVRGDPSIKIQRWAKEQAFYQAVAWFDEFLL